jgi:hypothetical protein
MAQRDPGKQVNIERTLQGLKKGSSAYSNIQQKILAGTYRTSKGLKEQNIKELMKTRARLTKKIDQGKSQQEKGNLGKIEKINKLLPILEDETNVESEPEVVPVQVKPIQLPIPTPEFLNALEDEEARLGSAAVQAPVPAVPVPAPAVPVPAPAVQAPIPEVQTPAPEVQAPAPQHPPLTQSSETSEESTNFVEPLVSTSESEVEARAPLTHSGENPDLDDLDISISESSSKYKYDPEFGNQVSDRKQMITLLKKALKNLEAEERAQQKQGVYSIPANLYDLLIQYVLNKDIDLSTILSLQFNGWNMTRSRTSLFEALWIIVIGFGFVPRFPIENIQLVDWRNVNKEQAPEVFKSSSNSSREENIINILKGMPFGTRPGGVSDITFYYSEKNPEEENLIYKSGCGKDSCETRKLINKVFISSVKFFELDIKKNIDKFDIPELIAATDILSKNNQEYEILLFVKDNKAVSNIVDQARKRYLANKVKPNNIFGESTLLSSLYSLRSKIFNNINTDIPSTVKTIYGREETPKSYLKLRFHQELIVEKAYHYVKTTRDQQKTILIGVLPRGGKTYICGGIVSKLNPATVLVLTHVPKETNKQFLNDLFNKFADFSDYEVKYLKDDTSQEEYLPNKKYIIFTSYQLLKKGYSLKKEGKEIKRKMLKAIVDKVLVPEICFLDEAHFGSAGNEAQEIYKRFDNATIRILMTATYIKPYHLFNIQPHQLFYWDYRDIQLGKKLKNADIFTEFRNRHLIEGEIAESTDTVFDRVLESQSLQGNSIEEIQKIYEKFPDIEIIDSQFEDKAKDAFRDQLLEDGSKGFSMEAILSINPKKNVPARLTNAYTLFNNPAIVGKFLNYIQPRDGSYLNNIRIAESNIEVAHIDGDLGNHFNIMDRIYEDSYLAGNRLTRGVPHTQIWFIPPSNGIQKRILALASLLLTHPWFSENFCVIGVSGGESDKIAQPGENEIINRININEFIDGECLDISCANSEDLKECIEKAERKNRCLPKPKGTIILTGFMLRMGISLGCADVVMLFDDDEHPDSTTQKQFRALTESEGKKKSYVVDLNPRRSIKAIYNHIVGVKSGDKKSDKVYQTIINTFGINSDRFLFASPGGKPINYGSLLHGIKQEYESAPVSKNINDLEKKADDLTKAFDDSEISKIMRDDFTDSYMKSMDIKIQKEKNRRSESDDDEMGGTGKKRIVVGTKGDNSLENNSGELITDYTKLAPVKVLSEEERFNNFKNIIDTTLKLIAFSYDAKTSDDVFRLIEENEEVRDLVYNTLLSRGLVQELMIQGHKRTSKGIVPKLTSIEQGVYNEKNNDQKQYIIRDILKTLKKMTRKETNMVYREMKRQANDKDIDQQKILKYIDDKLSPTTELKDQFGEVFTPMKIVNSMLDKLEESDPSIFEDKTKKWLDPASGMGNFPVGIFYRLMKKLKGVSRNPEERAEYIIKNMLYMVEIQKENSVKCKRIFKKLAPDVNANILTANTLTEFLVKKGGGDYIKSFGEGEPITFDIIIGNPPFNPPKTETGSSGNNIWANFVMKSFSLLNDKGYLSFIHPPGWKKPTEEDFKLEKFASGNYAGQIRQGQVWQVLKDSGAFKFIYTNDQKSRGVGEDYIKHFPAVDYYVYQKGGNKSGCDTKNVFLGTIEDPKSVRLNYNLKYLPNLITKQTQDILHKITSKEGYKPQFQANRQLTYNKNLFSKIMKYKYFYETKKGGIPVYAYSDIEIDNINENKVVLNFFGGIDGYYVQYLSKTDKIGSAHHSMYSKVESDKEGKDLSDFFKSDIVKFIFLITQYASGMRTMNEPLVANSITIPPEGIVDYYKFFGIEEHKKYIEDILAHYEKFKAPKRLAKTEKVKRGRREAQRRFTYKLRRT